MIPAQPPFVVVPDDAPAAALRGEGVLGFLAAKGDQIR
jgi:hypothetical protein